MEKTAVIFDIGRYRSTDGPGIRTIVFFKGCPLRCLWCSNPFGLSPKKQLSVNFARCTGCGACGKVCLHGVNRVEEGVLSADFSRCVLCGTCTAACPAGARGIVGREVTPAQIYQEAAKDEKFYRRGFGGVTFSGGEPLLQYEAAAQALALCRANYLNTCLETSAFAPWDHLKTVARFCNTVFVDLKHMDSTVHRALTGAPNEGILDNISRLCAYGRENKIRVILRLPLIPGYNDDEKELTAAGRFAGSLPGRPELNLLPYHNLGEEKYRQLGLEPPLAGLTPPHKGDPGLAAAGRLLAKCAPENRVSIGGDAIDLSRG